MSQDSFGSSDLCKALFKNAVEISQKLAELYRSTKMYADVTSPQAVLLRGQLKELCLRIMLESPCEFGVRAEDLAWRKVFYEPIQLLKKFQRRAVLANDLGLATAVKIQVMSAMGFYQSLLVSLQTRYSLDLRNIVDIPVVREPVLYHRSIGSHFIAVVDKETRDAVMDLCYKALVCLGNLARYQCDYLDDWTKMLPTRYYLQALMLKPDCGLPHNQLALLAGSRIVEGAYHWLLCICSKEPFLPAKRNLFDVLGRVHKRVSSMRRTTTTSMKAICSQLMGVVYQYLSYSDSHRPVSDQSLENLRISSEYALSNFRSYLSKCGNSALHRNLADDELAEDRKDKATGQRTLPSEMLFKLVVVFQAVVYLMEKQQDKGSAINKVSPVLHGMAVATSISLQSLLLAFFRDRMRFRVGITGQTLSVPDKINTIGNSSDESANEKRKERRSELRKPRSRHRAAALWNEFESDEPESDSGDCIRPIKEEDENEDKSCDGDDFSLSSLDSSVGGYESSVDDDNSKSPRAKSVDLAAGDAPTVKLSPFEAICEETWIPTVKIICDWLSSNRHILTMPPSIRPIGHDGEHFWVHLCELVNILPSAQTALGLCREKIRPAIANHVEQLMTSPSDGYARWTQQFVLPEDRAVGRFPALAKAHAGIDTPPLSLHSVNKVLNLHEGIVLRLCVLHHFCRFFGSERLKYSTATNLFSLRDADSRNSYEQQARTSNSDTNDAENNEDDDKFFTIRKTDQFPSKTTFLPPPPSAAVTTGVEAKKQQMKAMAELWLKSEISRLESADGASTSPPVIPIYAAITGDILLSLSGISAVRSLLSSKRLIVALPSAVISLLDAEKTSCAGAREASRFIEGELKKGTPYLRIYQQTPDFASSPSTKLFSQKFLNDARDFRTLPAVFNIVRQLLAENVSVPNISRCLVAIVSMSSSDDLPKEVSGYIDEEMKTLPNGGACVQFKSINALLADTGRV